MLLQLVLHRVPRSMRNIPTWRKEENCLTDFVRLIFFFNGVTDTLYCSITYRRKHREITTRREIDIKSSRRFAEESTGRGNVCACICAGNTCAGVRVRAYAQKCAG